MNDQTYNGWTNYETWIVKLWQDNEEGSQGFFAEMARHFYDDAKADKHFTQSERAALNLADCLKEYYEEQAQDKLQTLNNQCSVWADLLNASLSSVNWMEISRHLIEEHEENTVKAN